MTSFLIGLIVLISAGPFAVLSFQTVPSLGLAGKTTRTGNAAFSSQLFRSHQDLLLQLRSTASASTTNDPKQEQQDNIGAWIPIGSATALDGLGPQQITVMGLDLVVWKKNSDKSDDDTTSSLWSVLMDECPHRLAPLSQGRIDPDTNCIECPYHGWQFDTDGTLTSLPQLDEGRELSKQLQRTNSAQSLPVHLAGDLIFAFLPASVHGEMFPQSLLPEQMFRTVQEDVENNATYYVRELPYSADFLIENFMDPAHIPFAHHKLQSVRTEGSPIPMEVVANNFTHVEVSFEDVSRGRERTGIVSFQRPSVYHFRTKQEDGEYKTDLNIHIVPVRAGRSRVLFKQFTIKGFPTWLLHAGSNRFLNTDSWLHDAEIAARKRSSAQLAYKYASNSDIGVLTFRKWWKENGFSTAPPNTYGASSIQDLTKLSRVEQIDPWEYHSKQCSKCRKALKVLKKIKMGSWIVTVASAIFLKKWPIRAAILASVAMYASYMSSKAATAIEGNPHISGYGDRSVAAAAP